MQIPLERILQLAAWLASVVVVAMVVIFFTTGVGQDPLQFIHSSGDYLALLLRNPPALKAAIGLDNLFIVLYSTVFLCQSVLLLRLGAPRAMVLIAGGLFAFLALLDMLENFHFMVMLAQAEQGIAPSNVEIGAQVLESLLKFHIGYLGLFLFGLVLPRRNAKERLLSHLCVFVQLPVGLLIYITARVVSVPLVFVRFTFFVVALLLVASIFGSKRAVDSSAPV